MDYMKPESLNRTLAIIAWGKDDKGQDDVAIVTGILTTSDDAFFLHRGSENLPFRIQGQWLDRIGEVQPENKDLLQGADFQLSLSVGNLADDDLVSYKGL